MRLTIKQLRRLVREAYAIAATPGAEEHPAMEEGVIAEDAEWISRLSLAHAVQAAARKLVDATRMKDDAAFDSALDELKTEVNF